MTVRQSHRKTSKGRERGEGMVRERRKKGWRQSSWCGWSRGTRGKGRRGGRRKRLKERETVGVNQARSLLVFQLTSHHA